jgi:hypothetical protein
MKTKLLTTILGLLLLTNFVQAFAVSSLYWDENPLKLYPKESKDFALTLQNIVGTQDLDARIIIVTGSEIIKIKKPQEIYTIPAKTNKAIGFTATAPKDAKPGDIYPIRIEAETVDKPESGKFGIGIGVAQKFDIIIIEKPKQELLSRKQIFQIIIPILILLSILIIIYIIKRKKN